MATFPSKVDYATGDILTATNMNDVGGAINLLDGAQGSAGKNRALNSSMNVWQRGTSIAQAQNTTAYTADRWTLATYSNAASTVSRQVTGDTTNLPNIQYCARVQRNSGQTGTSGLNFFQSFESINSIPLAGKSVTISAYIRAGATYLSSGASVNFIAYSGTGTDQNVLVSYTSQGTVATVTPTLTANWQRITVTGTVPTTATELAVGFFIGSVGTAGATDYVEVTGVQLEAANSVSNYAPNGATYQAELAACQRYYQKSYNQGVTVPTNSSFGGSITGPSTSTVLNQSYGYIKFPVVMRIAPTVTTYSYTSSTTSVISNASGTDQAAGSGVASGIGDSGFGLYNSAATVTTTNGWLIHFQASSEL
jgi:hypothetical protein